MVGWGVWVPFRRRRPGSPLTGREPAGATTVISLPRPQEQPCLQGGACATGLIRDGDGSACDTSSCASPASPQPCRWSLCPFYGRGNQRPHSKSAELGSSGWLQRLLLFHPEAEGPRSQHPGVASGLPSSSGPPSLVMSGSPGSETAVARPSDSSSVVGW